MTAIDERPAPVGFDPSMVAALPEPARRWFAHAIGAGTPMSRCADLRMHGAIRLGNRWHDFTATQVLAPGAGFVWSARTHIAHLPVNGSDSYVDGEGAMRWRMLGLPVNSASGPDVTRSARDRLAIESVLLPTSLVETSWLDGPDANSSVFQHRLTGVHTHSDVTVRVGHDGALNSATVLRWGNPDGRAFREHLFEVTFDDELVCEGLRIPNGIHAAWAAPSGVTDEFFRARLDADTIR